MVFEENNLSIRIVSVDHYMAKPDSKFDTCYSEFRGSEIKQVPVIRLFGSSVDGMHSCVHIHGVFPFFYIPYDGSTSDRLAVDQKIYQLANALDKAINVSLGHSMSQAKHVFNILLVKGIPFYGYHHKAHHYLKIYMYNPQLVRKATQLLMNGTILSQTHQVHETHIPYILQFFIDYNLYGMSFLHLDTKRLRQRTHASETVNDVPPKMSTSAYEIDVLASDILNREPEDKRDDEFANPGIASIWKDEQARRLILGIDGPECMNLSQDNGSKEEIVTESDRFYRALLQSKLLKERSPASSAEDRRKTPAPSYPSEAAEEEMLQNASHIVIHDRDAADYSNRTLYASQISYHFDASTIDEDKIVSMSQNPDVTLDEQDYNLLEIMRELEEHETNNYEDDSLLAPLTQSSGDSKRNLVQVNANLSQASKRLNASLYGDLETVCLMDDQSGRRAADGDEAEFDSDDEFLLDFTQKQNDSIVRHGQNDDDLFNVCIPQLDGGDDSHDVLKRNRNDKDSGELLYSSSPKRVRIDLTQPITRKSITPRKVTFAKSPSKWQEMRSEKLLKKFEAESPNTLKKCEIRIPKLGLVKKPILNAKPKNENPYMSSDIPLKNFEVRLTKIDIAGYEMHEPGLATRSIDPCELSSEYDRVNNFDPMEGTSASREKSGDKKKVTKGPKGSKVSKAVNLEEEQQLEVLLSERFKNIVLLSPKVLLQPLTLSGKAAVNAELSLSDFPTRLPSVPSPKAAVNEGKIDEAKADEGNTADLTNSSNSSPELIKPAAEGEKTEAPVEKFTPPVIEEKKTDTDAFTIIESDEERLVINDNEGSVKDADVMDVEFSLPTNSDKEDDLVDKIAIFDTDSDTDCEPISADDLDEIGDLTGGAKPKEVNKESNPMVSIATQLDGAVDGKEQESKNDDSLDSTMIDETMDVSAHIQSFSEKTLLCELDDMASDSDDSNVLVWESEIDEDIIAICLGVEAPTREVALRAIETFEIPAVVNPTPFYSDPADVSGKTEVGHTVLNIAGNSLNDVEEFKSFITGHYSLKFLRYANLQRTFGEGIDEVVVGPNGPNADNMKELLATEGSVAITPGCDPPNRDAANSWIDSRLRKRHFDASANHDLDSPVKVKKAETIMCLGDNAEDNGTVEANGSPETLDAPAVQEEMPSPSAGLKQLDTVNKIADETSDDCQGEKQAAEETIEAIPASEQSDIIEQSNANISTATPIDNTYGFKVNYENLKSANSTCEYNYLTILSVEIHVDTRGDLRPNPSIDPIAAIFYRIHNDVPSDHPRASSACGIYLNRDQSPREGQPHGDGRTGYKYNQSVQEADIEEVADERELLEKFLQLISFWDPDIFTGYEVETASWGYVIERGYALEMNLMKMLSRVPTVDKVHVTEEEQQELLEMHEYSAGLKIPGRILLDIWRLMRHEIALTSYTFENVVYHILHRRVPNHSFRQLSRLWKKTFSRWVVLEYYLERVNGNLEILGQLDLIGRTAELAKLFGIQFYEVLSRGSQFRVESMMLRIAKPRNFVSVSPSIQQRAHMRAPEYLPLIMEPNSRFYADPLIVLDFQSLYPSVIIAYNYCFSTCLGRIEHLGESSPELEFEFGASHLRVPTKMLKALVDKNLVTFSPCGVAFVKKRVREGVMPRMLSEILNTRLMVKKSMKLHKDNSVLQRVLHSRQLGLKLIANVTYGYTAANFSGRMPCVEIGDSVVAKGRETLERAIKMVEDTERWGVKVVYGDTDSLFVLCPGRTKEAAFKIGEEIAEAVTKANPPPVKLKLEKVYQPSILQTKKRYVGYMYESADQKTPTYEAKGIETVRRDGCPVVAKMLEKVLRILFETCDMSQVKQYTCRQFTKILESRVNLQDFIFAKEFRGEDGYKPGACVPALELSRRWKQTDPRREPRRGQRVPYVIVNGPPLVPLIRLVRSPDEVLADEGLKINANYYITKAIIPPLNRCLLLIGADVHQWYNDLPRKMQMLHNTAGSGGVVGRSSVPGEQQMQKKSTITQYFSTTNCIVDCGRQTHHGVCTYCREHPQRSLVHVWHKVNKLERKLELTEKMCRSCCQRTFETACISLDCPVAFSLNRRALEYKQAQYYRDLVEELF